MIIGISGTKQSGKNTVALIWQLLHFESSSKYKEIIGSEFINDTDFVLACLEGRKEVFRFEHYFDWEQKSFASKLKQVVCVLTGCTPIQLENEEFKNSEVPYTWTRSILGITTYRELLQKLGTEVFRKNLHPEIWIDLLFQDFEKDQLKSSWIITDVRFKDEADAINTRGGTLIRIINSRDSANSTHQSEKDLDNYPYFQYFIDNSGSLESLIDQVRDIMRKEGVV